MVIEDMDCIKKKVMDIQEKMGTQDQLHGDSSPDVSQRSPSAGQNTIVGFDNVSIQLMEKLTGQQASRQIIPIVGMGSIGKTTLARNIYEKLLIVKYFDRRAWVTISQEYSVQQILLELLCQISKENREILSRKSEKDLGVQLHKTLSNRRYLIIIDDIWSTKAWDRVKFFFPDNNNGSRIMITTRLTHVALNISGTSGLEMNFLDEDKSWNLLCKIVFGEECCPLDELEEIGKKIAKSCKGLPLSIVVIGGLLAKSKQTREYWESIADNLNSIVNLEDNERCLKILHTSYNQLPVHLKPCFLYVGAFPEDTVIRSSELIKLWVAEGFLKPINGKILEEVAEECLKGLIDRNLILVQKWGTTGKIISFKIHDLLRDLCLREAKKEKFLYVRKEYSLNIPHSNTNTQRRIAIHRSTELDEEHLSLVSHAVQSASLARSFICDRWGVMPSLNSRLLRILRLVDKESKYFGEYSLEALFQLVNLRHLEFMTNCALEFAFPYSACLLWNLHTLIVKDFCYDSSAPPEIWKMPQLRHVEFKALYLPDPPCGQLEGEDDCVLENLQTLLEIVDLKFSEEVVKKIPNVKKLIISYFQLNKGSGSHYCLNNIGCLHKLESLACSFLTEDNAISQSLSFPRSLKKLNLSNSYLRWEDMSTKIGSLPFLEVLKLKDNSFIGHEWETVGEQFPSLKFLLIYGCFDLKYWKTDSTHFPRLQHLVLNGLFNLKEIPFGIGEIPTLKLIELYYSPDSAVISAKEMQDELGDVDWKVRVRTPSSSMESLASDNFLVTIGM